MIRSMFGVIQYWFQTPLRLPKPLQMLNKMKNLATSGHRLSGPIPLPFYLTMVTVVFIFSFICYLNQPFLFLLQTLNPCPIFYPPPRVYVTNKDIGRLSVSSCSLVRYRLIHNDISLLPRLS